MHAAGDYDVPGQSLFECAVSSFTPSVTALLASPASQDITGILTVSQPQTSGLSPLPGTTEELDQVCKHAKFLRVTRLEDDQATPSAVLEALDSHSWVHLACHASQNVAIPVESAFHLHGGPLDLGSIAEKHLKNADLAFLSACQTATGDVGFPEEAMHLAAGMLMAGYRRVIASMWSINDEDAPLVAEKFYTYMLDDVKPSHAKAGRALHYAVGSLRDKIGVKEFTRWAPYIHIGF